MRISVASERLPQVLRGDAFEIVVDGQVLTAYPGETIAAVLLANGIRDFHHEEEDQKSGVYCGIGRCFCCRVAVDGEPDIRACVTPARSGMQIDTSNKGERI